MTGMVDLPDRQSGVCPRCGLELELFEPTHGYRYWTCPACHSPPVIQMGPEIVTWSITEVVVGLGVTSLRSTDLGALDAEAADPTRFVDRLCEAFEGRRQWTREKELDRRADEADHDSAADGTQADLAGWSK
ncbi:hypothetical protein [Halolamina salifodinae]|uniref:Rubredoxin n=1 Tax=Halolamina salifodinae TaxID=1202767 RepID=A0A8T4GUY4_9EURY|nr:hypothetical protein [Halolamina salifodinae]MBP1985932.1 rubredoxin [Halolamina salifodinae]